MCCTLGIISEPLFVPGTLWGALWAHFVNQKLAPGETKEMVVRYVVGSDLPEKITTMTLSYTFFKASEDNVAITKQDRTKKIKENG